MGDRIITGLLLIGLLLVAIGVVSLLPLEVFSRSFIGWAFGMAWAGMVVFLIGAFLGLVRHLRHPLR